MAVVQRNLVSDQVFRHLAADILSGRYRPGEKLPTQRALAADLGVNMASIREAVKRLEQMRLIEVRQGDAMRVRDWRSHGNLDVVAHLVLRPGGLDQATLADVLEVRRLTLGEVARLAAHRCTDEEASRLMELAGRLMRSEDIASAQRLDWSFFTELVEAAHNVVFALIMNSIRQLYFDAAELFQPLVGELERLAPRYAEIATAVASHDPERAATTTFSLAREQEQDLKRALGLGP